MQELRERAFTRDYAGQLGHTMAIGSDMCSVCGADGGVILTNMGGPSLRELQTRRDQPYLCWAAIGLAIRGFAARAAESRRLAWRPRHDVPIDASLDVCDACLEVHAACTPECAATADVDPITDYYDPGYYGSDRRCPECHWRQGCWPVRLGYAIRNFWYRTRTDDEERGTHSRMTRSSMQDPQSTTRPSEDPFKEGDRVRLRSRGGNVNDGRAGVVYEVTYDLREPEAKVQFDGDSSRARIWWPMDWLVKEGDRA